MKLLSLAVMASVGLAATMALAGSIAGTRTVQVKESPLRAGPSFLGNPVGKVSYGDKVSVLVTRSGWVEVTSPSGQRGWVHASALSEKRIAMESGTGKVGTGASTDEIALAGKGFSQQVEDEYKSTRAISFEPVDQMEKRRASRDDLLRFVEKGGLGKGGAQ